MHGDCVYHDASEYDSDHDQDPGGHVHFLDLQVQPNFTRGNECAPLVKASLLDVHVLRVRLPGCITSQLTQSRVKKKGEPLCSTPLAGILSFYRERFKNENDARSTELALCASKDSAGYPFDAIACSHVNVFHKITFFFLTLTNDLVGRVALATIFLHLKLIVKRPRGEE